MEHPEITPRAHRDHTKITRRQFHTFACLASPRSTGKTCSIQLLAIDLQDPVAQSSLQWPHRACPHDCSNVSLHASTKVILELGHGKTALRRPAQPPSPQHRLVHEYQQNIAAEADLACFLVRDTDASNLMGGFLGPSSGSG
eukprot:CAMPEP_0119401234 /NCGR_PEP_ID=MMETSP1334-20130426/142268_1 /TAXON_ID=127549 /ORGANISM="Calcidiscus leptoporus, Strain RCC1130" /LENGTH=141 /DNA_ID=CAMNT_0007425149 /DNA_START=456 /DNA_END=877 /DNA_ORIENTATION=+